METLDVVRGDQLAPLAFRHFPDTKACKPRGRLTGQRPAAGVIFLFGKSIYVDDEAVLADTRQGSVDSGSLLKKHLLRFGLIMHTGTTEKRSKTRPLS